MDYCNKNQSVAGRDHRKPDDEKRKKRDGENKRIPVGTDTVKRNCDVGTQHSRETKRRAGSVGWRNNESH
jgi:hypothetical protein